jgi:RNA polymerase sigma factor (sigma-70 family)
LGLSTITEFNFKKDFKLEAYEPFLRGVVKEVQKKFSSNPRWDFDELMSEAWLALVQSSETYNPEYSNNFLYYARSLIYVRLLDFISSNIYTFKAKYYNIKNDENKLQQINFLENSIFTETKNTSPEKDNPLLSVPSGLDIASEIADKEETNIIGEIINTKLNKKQKEAISLRFKDDLSYREIGEKIGCSGEEARRIVLKSVKKIKHGAIDAGLKSNYD